MDSSSLLKCVPQYTLLLLIMCMCWSCCLLFLFKYCHMASLGFLQLKHIKAIGKILQSTTLPPLTYSRPQWSVQFHPFLLVNIKGTKQTNISVNNSVMLLKYFTLRRVFIILGKCVMTFWHCFLKSFACSSAFSVGKIWDK